MKKRFLVVDDQSMIRCFLKDLFRHFDLDCEEARNGREAIEKWEQEKYTAILMDIEMPVMDGLEAAAIIRAREKSEQRGYTPIYAISGCTFADPHQKCRLAGMDGFIAKPVMINELLDIIMPLANAN
ncbi:MAG: response regulator [Thermodesulfobacteriota bacterium]